MRPTDIASPAGYVSSTLSSSIKGTHGMKKNPFKAEVNRANPNYPTKADQVSSKSVPTLHIIITYNIFVYLYIFFLKIRDRQKIPNIPENAGAAPITPT
jgi:hypothetical protein